MPYTVRRGSAIESRIEQLARRATMVDLLTGGLDSFIDFQDESAGRNSERYRRTEEDGQEKQAASVTGTGGIAQTSMVFALPGRCTRVASTPL